MVITRKQNAQFVEYGYEQFTKKLKPLVQQQYPEKVAGRSDEDVMKQLRYCVQKARKYGFSYEHDVAKFVFFCFELGDNFDENPDNRAVVLFLKDNTMSAKIRLTNAAQIIYNL
ncbi:hypothetical protein GO730_28285 [Spirosoma sp. HMF3257]|uniref:Uncharacterized protein n=1 Tax=Spirosoma telluris TaxID=2183553 RepID=A0A327NR21_9BACT|nr:hypothetical protein [Spirosoma telluris]RAI77103.1 hypothetical protein HMF3257_28230 [Spirosoma telluris]